VQVNNTWGYDKGKSARSFVNNLLPHLAQIVVQDGMYLTTTYPNHPYSKLLLQKMQNVGYEKWATDMRSMVQERELIYQESFNEE
jgi:hypothetical protein